MAVNDSIWAGLIGHEANLAALDRAVARDRTPHGMLFAGPDGIGKTSAALGLAQRLCCEAEQKPCGACRACRAILHGNHPGAQVMRPEWQAGSSAAGVRIHKIDTIRQLIHEVSLRAFGAGWRVLVIRTAEALREEAANCLLKTLEEPPPQVVLVLTAEQPAQLLPTVISRVQRFDFAPVATDLIAGWLAQRHGVSPAEAALAARVAAGRPARALGLALDPEVRQRRQEVLALAAELGHRPPAAGLVAADRLLAGAESAEAEGEPADRGRVTAAVDLLEWWYRDALVWRATSCLEKVANQDLLNPLQTFAARFSAAELRAGMAALQQARLSLRRNGNPRLVLEVLWLRLARGGRAAGHSTPTVREGPPQR